MTFLLGGVFIHFEGCSEVLMYFLFLLFCFFSLIYTGSYVFSFLTFRTYLSYIYDDVSFFTYLSMCGFFSLFIHMFLYVCNPLFLFHRRYLKEFCLSVS